MKLRPWIYWVVLVLSFFTMLMIESMILASIGCVFAGFSLGRIVSNTK